jgi:polysaccharide biosynthesis protein PslF
MRVCLITGEYPPMQGGVGDYTRELGLGLAQLGVEVNVLTSRQAESGSSPLAPRQIGRLEDREGNRLHYPEITIHPVVDHWDWRIWKLVRDLAVDVNTDLIHIQYQTAAFGMHPAINFLPLYLRLRHGHVRSVVTFHDLREPYLFPKAGLLRRWINLRLARSTNSVIVTNEEDLSEVERWNTRRSSLECTMIPIGSNISCASPVGFDRIAWRARWGLKPDDVLLSYFGFLNTSKGGETLIQALAQLVQKGSPVFLVMVGGLVGASDPTNVEYLGKITKLITELGLDQRVFWTGFTGSTEVSANLLASDLCVLPYLDGASYRRGSFMAALAHGLPIVTTYPPSSLTRQSEEKGKNAIPDLRSGRMGIPLPALIDGENVRLVPPSDPVAMADAIRDVMTSLSLQQRLAEGARRTATAFSWTIIAQQTLEVYQRIMDCG